MIGKKGAFTIKYSLMQVLTFLFFLDELSKYNGNDEGRNENNVKWPGKFAPHYCYGIRVEMIIL